MQKQLEDAKTTWSLHEKLLESEHCLLEKMIYKMSSQFRSEKSLRSMNQVRSYKVISFSRKKMIKKICVPTLPKIFRPVTRNPLLFIWPYLVALEPLFCGKYNVWFLKIILL